MGHLDSVGDEVIHWLFFFVPGSVDVLINGIQICDIVLRCQDNIIHGFLFVFVAGCLFALMNRFTESTCNDSPF